MSTLAAPAHETRRDSYRVIVMSASAGGQEALSEILCRLPATFPVPIVVVLHHAPGRTRGIVQILRRRTKLGVCAATDGDALEAGHVYLAPPDRHMWLTSERTIASSNERRINYRHSSAEPLLTSVASLFGRRAIAVILTGSGKNGAGGAKALHDAGGLVLAQDRATSRHFGMPDAAIKAGAVDHVVPLGEIGPALLALTRLHRRKPVVDTEPE